MQQFFSRGIFSTFIICVSIFSGYLHAENSIVLEPIKVSEHVHYFRGESGVASQANKGFMSNAGFVVSNNGVVVYDALATPVLGQAMVDAIRRVTKQPIKLVIAGHYHADHIYGLQAFKKVGAQIWGHENGKLYLNSDAAKDRLAQRRADLSPWVDAQTIVPQADRWLSFAANKEIRFQMGEIRFKIFDSSGAHSDEDVLLMVENDSVLFSGDLFFTGRIPFVGNANSTLWLKALERMAANAPAIVIPGHGPVSNNARDDIAFTRSYLLYLREKMGAAVQELQSFEEAYQQTDWHAYEKYPAFQAANRLNAYGTFLLMEKESLQKP